MGQDVYILVCDRACNDLRLHCVLLFLVGIPLFLIFFGGLRTLRKNLKPDRIQCKICGVRGTYFGNID